MRQAQQQGPAASGVDANFIHFFRHVPTFSWIYSAAFCRNITPRRRRHGPRDKENAMPAYLIIEDHQTWWWDSADIRVVPGNDPNGVPAALIAGTSNCRPA